MTVAERWGEEEGGFFLFFLFFFRREKNKKRNKKNKKIGGRSCTGSYLAIAEVAGGRAS